MKKAQFDMDVCKTIRKSPEAQPGTLSTYTALREIATEKGSCDFTTTINDVSRRALLSDTGCSKAMSFMQRRRLIDKHKTGRGIRVRLLRVAKA